MASGFGESDLTCPFARGDGYVGLAARWEVLIRPLRLLRLGLLGSLTVGGSSLAGVPALEALADRLDLAEADFFCRPLALSLEPFVCFSLPFVLDLDFLDFAAVFTDALVLAGSASAGAKGVETALWNSGTLPPKAGSWSCNS